jgi:hypothetical protein
MKYTKKAAPVAANSVNIDASKHRTFTSMSVALYKDMQFSDDGKQLSRVLLYYKACVGTSLDCMIATGIMRNCITWYIKELESLGMIQAVYRLPDKHTHFKAKYYSANKELWNRNDSQLNLWEGKL